MYNKKSSSFRSIPKVVNALPLKKKIIFSNQFFFSFNFLNKNKSFQVSFKSSEANFPVYLNFSQNCSKNPTLINFKKPKFLLNATKFNLKYNLKKTEKISIDWHSKDLLIKNDLGIWFYNCFQPFSTRKYWWILLPSQTLLFRLRWETISQFKFSNKTHLVNEDYSKFYSVKWFNEKPLYIYWILPFFGCLNIISFSLSTELNAINKTSNNSNFFFFQNSFSSNSNIDSPKTIILSWETLNYLTYKQNLLDLSCKFIQKVNYYHDSIIYEVSPNWFNYFQEQYIGNYSGYKDYDSLLQNFKGAQNTIIKKSKKLLNQKNNKFVNYLSIEKNNEYKNKIEFQNTHQMEFWWNQELYTKKDSFEILPFKFLNKNKETINFLHLLQKSSLVKTLIPVLKKNANMTQLEFKKTNSIWNNFLYQKSQFNWCWYTLIMSKTSFVKKNKTFFLNNSNFINLIFKMDRSRESNKLNLFEKNQLLHKNIVSKNNMSLSQALLGFSESNLLNFFAFDKFKFLNLSLDEFSQKILIGNTTFPVNYLCSKYLDRNLTEFDFSNLYFLVKQFQFQKKYKFTTFALAKFPKLMGQKFENNFFNFIELEKLNLNKNLIGIYSTSLIPNQISNEYYLDTAFRTTVHNKNLVKQATKSRSVGVKNIELKPNHLKKNAELDKLYTNFEFLNHLLDLEKTFKKLLNNYNTRIEFFFRKNKQKKFFFL